jgi:hypothetical protein
MTRIASGSTKATACATALRRGTFRKHRLERCRWVSLICLDAEEADGGGSIGQV